MLTLPSQSKLAVLIDAENGISPDVIPLILDSVYSVLDQSKSRLSVILRRAYGNWFLDSLHAWQSVLAEAEIEPVCTPVAKSGNLSSDYKSIKNAADMRLVIDAMELLLLQQINCFCIVSSDRDFTPLIRRLKELGAIVIGCGRTTASATLKQSYHKFIPLETLRNNTDSKSSQPSLQVISGSGGLAVAETAQPSGVTQQATQSQLSSKQINQLLRTAYQQCASSTNWITVKEFQQQLQALCSKQKVQFSCARFGCKSMEKLIEKLGSVEWDASQANAKQLTDRRFKLKQAA